MKVAIYSRKSRSSEKGKSIQNQIAMCKEHMMNNFNISEFIIYKDDGFSGGNSDRPEYKKMLRDAKNKKFSTLICYRLDRVSRSISDFSDTIEMLNSLDIAFISLKEQFDTSTPMGRAMMYIASVFAQLERETIAERIRDNMLSLARTGRWLGGNPPTGYKSTQIIYYDEKSNKKTMNKLEQLPKDIYIVKQIFNKYLEFSSLNQVESWSLENNIKTSNGNFFNITGLRSILTNMVYVKADKNMFDYCKNLDMDIASNKDEFNGTNGLMVYNKNIIKKGKANKLRPRSEWIVAVGKHKGIISSKDFITIQDTILKNQSKAPRTIRNNISILTPLIKCSNCNKNLRTTYGTKRKDGTRLHYYKCTLKEKSKGKLCNSPNLNGRKADALIMSRLKDLTFSFTDYIGFIKDKREDILFLLSLSEDNSRAIKNDIIKYKNMIKKLTNSLSLTTDLKVSKHIIEQIENLDAKIVKSDSQLLELFKENTFSEEDKLHMENIKQIITNLNNSIDTLKNSEKRYILNTIISSIFWSGDSLKVYFK